MMAESTTGVSSGSVGGPREPLHHQASGSKAGVSSSSASLKGANPSQARLRMLSMVTQVDHKLAALFTILLTLYAMITLTAMARLDSQDMSDNIVMTTVTKTHAVATTRATAENSSSIIQPKMVDLREIHDIETLQHTFPVHVGDDMEEIDHPGILLADKQQMKDSMDRHPELPRDGKMRVPRVWSPVSYGEGGVRSFLGENGKRLITKEEALSVGSFDPVSGLETIYISVASYRDPECQPTVEDIFLRAEHPDRLRVAVIDQRAENDSVPQCAVPTTPCSQDPSQTLCKYHHLIDRFEVPAHLSIGPVFARHLANRMYRGEYFAMQVDSHVRFIRNWDSDLISQWRSARNEMAVLTVYLSDLIGSIDPVTFENTHPNRPIMCKTDYEGNGKMRHLRHGQQPEGKPGIHGEPTLHPFWAAGFSFGRGHFPVQVPYDQYSPMVFQGEEIFQGLRGFTYGYDYYTPETSVAFHMYALKENKAKRKQVKLFWENQNLYPGSAVEGMKRLNGIIGMGDPEDEDKYFRRDEALYGLGKARPKEQFFKLYGIHTDTKTVEDHLCTFVGKKMQEAFTPHLRSNGMGINFDEFEFAWVDPRPPAPKQKVK